MYLEDKLDQLVLTVDRLIVVMEQLLEQQSPGAPAPKQDAQPPQPEQKAPEQVAATDTPNAGGITKDILQDYALTRVRDEGKAFKATLIDALGKYGAKTISQLPDDEAAKAVYAVIGGGK